MKGHAERSILMSPKPDSYKGDMETCLKCNPGRLPVLHTVMQKHDFWYAVDALLFSLKLS